MTYTPNVPQANQTIAQTTSPIRDNFTYLDDALQEEHSFNGSAPGVLVGTHLRTSMPNQADPGSLPAGTNGTYYVNGGNPKFYNGNAWLIQYGALFQGQISAVVALTTSATNLSAIPANSVGYYFIVPPGGISPTDASAMGQFVTGAANMRIGDVSDPGITISNTGLTLRARVDSSSDNGNYTFVILYYTP